MDYSHPMNCTPDEYQRFLPGAYANYSAQAQKDHDLFLRRFPVDKSHTTYLTHPHPVRTTDYLNQAQNKSLPSATEYYSEDNRLADGPKPKAQPDRQCESRPARVVTVNRESVDREVHRYHPGEGTYKGFSENVDTDSRGKGLGKQGLLSKCPEQKFTPKFPGETMENLHPVPEGLERIYQKSSNHQKQNPQGCCHRGNQILHCQDKIGLPSCDGPLLQSHYPSSGRSDRYLQAFKPEQYKTRDEHSFEWREYSRREGNYRPEVRNRRTGAESQEAVPFQLECTRVKKPEESCERCHHLFNNMTRRKNLFL